MTNKKILTLAVPVFMILGLALPHHSQALSGTNIKNTKIRVDTKQGGDWFRVVRKETTHKGVLVMKDVLPGDYKMTVTDSDEKNGQTLAVELRMLDNKGRKIREKVDVDLYMYINGMKTPIGTVKTDDDGWIKVSGLYLDTRYVLDIDEGRRVKDKDGELAVKTLAKIDDSDWFTGIYKNTEDMVLEVRNVLPGKYKFETRGGSDRQFTLRAQLLDEKGRDAEDTAVDLYVYNGGSKQFAGRLTTDKNGWITIPGVYTNMKYRIKVHE